VLKQRLITATILSILIIWAVFGLSNDYFAIFFGVFIIAAGNEWTQLTNMKARWQRVFFLLLLLMAMIMLWRFNDIYPWLTDLILSIAVVWWILCAMLLIIKSRGFKLASQPFFLVSLVGLLVLLPPWLALVSLHASESHGPAFVIFLMLLTSFADIGAFFAGRRWGSKKLSPHISPAKTWEGVWGAATVVVILSVVVGTLFFDLTVKHLLMFVPFCIVILFFAVIGDLFESMVKRQAQVKDSGQLFPGHGGVLDRIDSLTAAAPIFAAGLLVQEMMN